MIVQDCLSSSEGLSLPLLLPSQRGVRSLLQLKDYFLLARSLACFAVCSLLSVLWECSLSLLHEFDPVNHITELVVKDRVDLLVLGNHHFLREVFTLDSFLIGCLDGDILNHK